MLDNSYTAVLQHVVGTVKQCKSRYHERLGTLIANCEGNLNQLDGAIRSVSTI